LRVAAAITLLCHFVFYSENQRQREKERERARGREMEKALTKVTSFKVGSSWISKKAKEELSNITNDLTVSAP